MLKLVVTGTGAPTFVGTDRAGPSALIIWHPDPTLPPTCFVVDAGRWVTQRLAESGVSWMHAAAVFFTHHHMDHLVGWPDLCMTGWLMGRSARWRVFGPPPTLDFCRLQEISFAYDRTHRGGVDVQGALTDVTEITTPGLVLDEGGVRVTAAVVPHGGCEVALAYRFEAGGRAIVISGDCSPSDALVELAAGADVLLHEVLHRPSLAFRMSRRSGATEAAVERLVSVHTTSDQVGKIATRAGVKQLVLTHFIPPSFGPEDLHRTVAADFDGPIVLADDLTRV